METAVVHRNLTDINAEPHYLAERKTQALFGEILTVGETREEYALVRQTDGYEGWARHAALTEIQTPPAGELWFVTDPVTPVFNDEGEQTAPYFLTYGAHVQPLNADNNSREFVEISAPRGGSLWLEAAAISRPLNPEMMDRASTAESILNAAHEFLGVPYLWGGRSALGLDCSALVQLIYGFHGVTLPRDSGDQRVIGEEVARADLQPADLIFSPGHVVIYEEKDTFIHASLGEGGVALNSFDSSAADYRADLDRDYLVARRHF